MKASSVPKNPFIGADWGTTHPKKIEFVGLGDSVTRSYKWMIRVREQAARLLARANWQGWSDPPRRARF